MKLGLMHEGNSCAADIATMPSSTKIFPQSDSIATERAWLLVVESLVAPEQKDGEIIRPFIRLEIYICLNCICLRSHLLPLC